MGDSWEFLSDHYKERIVASLQEKNISVYLNAHIEEAIGEGVVKAVKIVPLKVFSSQVLMIDSGFVANRDFFEEDIEVTNGFLTNYEGVYCIGDAAWQDRGHERFFTSHVESAREQGRQCASYVVEGVQPTVQSSVPNDSQQQAIDAFLHQLENIKVGSVE